MEELLLSYFSLRDIGRYAVLRRVIRVGVLQLPKSNVRWTRGKGAIGACWESEAVERADLRSRNRTYGGCAEHTWMALSADERMNTDFADWKKTRRKYDGILVVPVFLADKFVGCVALTGPWRNQLMTKPEVEQALAGAAATIANAA